MSRRRRFLFTVSGGRGHIQPMLPAARALKARGHDVAFAGPGDALEHARERGIRCIPAGPPNGVGAFAPSDATRGQLERLSVQERIAASNDVFGAYGEAMARSLLDDTERPDAVVRETMAWGGWLAGSSWEVPTATIDFIRLPEFVLNAWAPSLNAHRAGIGLATDEGLETVDAWLSINPVPANWLEPHELGRSSHVVQPGAGESRSNDAEFPELAKLEPPVVYATLGTAFNQTEGAWESILEALSALPVSVVGTVGDSIDPASFGPLPERIRLFRFVPQDLVLPHCQLVVSHGGFGTLTGALAAGKPVACLPLGPPDNLTNAERVARLNAGVVVPIESRSADAVRAAVVRVLDEPAFAHSAANLAEVTRALPPPEHAATLLEELVETGLPVAAS